MREHEHPTITPLPASTPGPDLPVVLQTIHRGTPDGYVVFARRHPARAGFDFASVPVAALRAGEPQPWLPHLLDQLMADGYVSVSAFYRAGYRLREREEYRPAIIEGQHVEVLTTRTSIERIKRGTGGLRYPYREAAGARWLTACWADCDGYTVGLDAPATIGGIIRAYRRGMIPPPSFIVGTGRGAWPMWQLVDARNPVEGSALIPSARGPGHGVFHGPLTPLRASSYALRLHQAVNLALATRLQHLGADLMATDAARCVRVAGSINTSADDAVVEILPVLIAGAMHVYTIEDLAARLGVALTPGRRYVRGTLSEAQRLQRHAAASARHRKVFMALLRLSRRRRGLRDGEGRHLAVYHLALAGLQAGIDRPSIEAATAEVAGACRPPLPAADRRASIRSAEKRARSARSARPVAYRTLVAAHGISAEEARTIGLTPRPPRQRRRQTQGRLDAIEAIIAAQGHTPTCRRMVRQLAEAGFTANVVTVSRDYQRLGYVSGDRGGRPKRLPGL